MRNGGATGGGARRINERGAAMACVLAHAHWQRGAAAQASAMGQESDGEFRGMERGSAGEFQDGQAYSSVLAGVQRRS